MALFSTQALLPGVKRREVFGWAMYDFANSGYTTVVLTAVYANYFAGVIAQKAEWATFAWTLALSISYALVMLTLPVIGAYADLRAQKKKLLALSTLICVFSTIALSWPGPGQLGAAMLLIVVSNTFFSYGESLNAAFLPELAQQKAMGQVSGWGWSLGYLGGMLSLGLCLAYVMWAKTQGVPATQFVPVTLWITAGLYGLASLVTFALLPERAKPQMHQQGTSMAWMASLRQLRSTLHQAKRYRDFMWLLGSTVFYQAGVATTIALAAIYAEQVIGFEVEETMSLIFVLNIAAACGALVLGYAQDRWGHKRALMATLVGWLLTCVFAAMASSKGQFWWAATIAGLCMGSSQSAGRAMAGLFAPAAQLAEFFGLWGFAVRLASILGPISYGSITWAAGGDQRQAILFTALLFGLGLLFLLPIRVERGRQAANSSVREHQ